MLDKNNKINKFPILINMFQKIHKKKNNNNKNKKQLKNIMNKKKIQTMILNEVTRDSRFSILSTNKIISKKTFDFDADKEIEKIKNNLEDLEYDEFDRSLKTNFQNFKLSNKNNLHYYKNIIIFQKTKNVAYNFDKIIKRNKFNNKKDLNKIDQKKINIKDTNLNNLADVLNNNFFFNKPKSFKINKKNVKVKYNKNKINRSFDFTKKTLQYNKKLIFHSIKSNSRTIKKNKKKFKFIFQK